MKTTDKAKAVALLLTFFAAGRPAGAQAQNSALNTGMADAAALSAAYDRFLGANPNPNLLAFSVSHLRGISSEAVNAGGNLRFDLAAGTLVANVRGLPAGEFELWLVDNAGAGSTLANSGDVLVKVGALTVQAPGHTLSGPLPPLPPGFFPDRAFVVRSGETPLTSFLLTGSPSFFDRMRRRQVANLDPTGSNRLTELTALVASGRRLFLQETFSGNGRSCGTCHVESNNFTIDPDLIAKLPLSDPLFVAETNPALAQLERSALLRKLGVILVNADGFDDLAGKFVLRSTQNVQALANSTVRPLARFGLDFTGNGRNPDPPERLGWGQDAPALRDFPLVAIAQHATKRLSRAVGVDFRMPTDAELDGLAGYQLALGRQEDVDLPTVQLNSALAMKGKALYLDTGSLLVPGQHKNCNACHFNAGGTSGFVFTPGLRMDASPLGFNMAAPTNVNETPEALGLGASLPRDGGFGVLPLITGGFGNTDDLPPPFGHLEIEEFNTPSLVESADTAPFFHNHTVKDLESAVAFYGTPAFQTSPFSIGAPGGIIPVNISSDPKDPEVQAISAMLRVLNALENIRSAINVAIRGRGMAADADARELAVLANEEVTDAIQVLNAGALEKSAELGIVAARAEAVAARELLVVAGSNPVRAAINATLDQAVNRLRRARNTLANPATLPASFRN